MPTKGKYVTKKKPILTWPRPNNNCTNPYTFEQNMLRNKTISHKKKTFLMQILTRDSEDTFFSWPIQRTHEAEEEYFSHKKPPHLTWSVQTTNWCWGLGPARAPADQFSELSKKAHIFSDVLCVYTFWVFEDVFLETNSEFCLGLVTSNNYLMNASVELWEACQMCLVFSYSVMESWEDGFSIFHHTVFKTAIILSCSKAGTLECP